MYIFLGRQYFLNNDYANKAETIGNQLTPRKICVPMGAQKSGEKHLDSLQHAIGYRH